MNISKNPPYFAAIFSSKRSKIDDGYQKMSEYMGELSKSQKGFLGLETVRNEDGFGITISYWESEEDIIAWKNNATHLKAQMRGKNEWYENFEVKIAQVNRAYSKN
jgi:heme-degrading monooxygenase HmoA